MSDNNEPTTYTRVTDHGEGFPENLIVRPTGKPIPAGLGDWVNRHNRAINDFDAGYGVNLRHERAILSLAQGIDQWAGSSGYADDGFLGPECFVPLMQAFRAALNGELGRLDGGTLDTWACRELESHGYDPDTYEWKHDES